MLSLERVDGDYFSAMKIPKRLFSRRKKKFLLPLQNNDKYILTNDKLQLGWKTDGDLKIYRNHL